MRDDDINVSEKHVKLRTAAFILALVLAVSAFSVAIANIGKKEPGYYMIETDPDEEAPLYASGMDLRYYFEGSSNEIKQAMKFMREDYGTVLKRMYKLLDGENEYEGFQNIATLNKYSGKEINVNSELYAVLQDAYAKTLEEKGFNMFAGALYREWHSILILDEPAEFDPLYNDYERERIEKIAEMANDLENFSLEFLDDEKFTVKFTVSEKFLKFLEEMELEGALIDLNELHDAYMLDKVREIFDEKGYSNGYITTASGLTVSLASHSGEYLIYSAPDGNIVQAGAVTAEPGTVCSLMKAVKFAEDEDYYYSLPEDDLLRHPYFSVKTGNFADIINVSYVIGKNSAADACYLNLQLNAAESAEEIEALSDTPEFAVLYTTQTAPDFFKNPAAFQIFKISE